MLIGLWLFLTCFLWTDKAPQTFDRCVVGFMIKAAGIALLIGAVVLVLRKRVWAWKKGPR